MIHFIQSQYGTEIEKYLPEEFLSRDLKLGDVESFECVLAHGKLHTEGKLSRAKIAQLTQQGECALFYCDVPDSQVKDNERDLIENAALEVTSIIVFVTEKPDPAEYDDTEKEGRDIAHWLKRLNDAVQIFF